MENDKKSKLDVDKTASKKFRASGKVTYYNISEPDAKKRQESVVRDYEWFLDVSTDDAARIENFIKAKFSWYGFCVTKITVEKIREVSAKESSFNDQHLPFGVP